MEVDISIIIDNVLFLCEKKGIKPRDLSTHTSLSAIIINNLLKGRNVSIATLAILAHYFCVTIEYLVTKHDVEDVQDA